MSEREGPRRHVPVMEDEVAEALAVRPGGRYVDATIGEGGHAERILSLSSPDGRLLGLDWDAEALALAGKHLAAFGDRVILRQESFSGLRTVLDELGWADGADGVLLDLGVSTLQVTEPRRGFTFSADAPLDMRMDTRLPRTAADLLAQASESELADLIYRYGEERAARRIARVIVQRRAERPLQTTGELRAAVLAAGVRGRPRHDPATRTFQALRIAVNQELAELERFLESGWQSLRPAGRMAILTYHSLEDRLVKQAFRRWAADCVCPPGRPICDCGWQARARAVTRRKRKASAAEIARNPRARSAGLRVVERLET